MVMPSEVTVSSKSSIPSSPISATADISVASSSTTSMPLLSSSSYSFSICSASITRLLSSIASLISVLVNLPARRPCSIRLRIESFFSAISSFSFGFYFFAFIFSTIFSLFQPIKQPTDFSLPHLHGKTHILAVHHKSSHAAAYHRHHR